jgi:uncharacterized damage-inducible protein DinB
MNIKDLFGYNWFARRKFLKSMTELPWERVVKSCGASFDCIRDIFMHSLQSELFWIRVLSRGNVREVFETPFNKFPNIEAMQEYADKVEAETNEYLKTLTDEKLQSIFEYRWWDGTTKQNKIEDILMNVIEEEIHHRGELLCIYWQADITPPHAGYLSYVNQEG